MTAAAGRRRVGILGGMGPEATVLLMSRVIAMTPASDDRDHVPMLVDNNTQVPSRIEALIEKTGEDPGPVLVDMARRLAAAGVEALAMPCNTAHHYAPLLTEAVSIPLLDMVELSAEHAARLDRSSASAASCRVGMLVSPAVGIAGVFERAFAARGLQAIYPAQPERMLACIRAIKATGRNDAAIVMLRDAAAELRAAGADVLLVACTELSLIADSLSREVPVVDTIDVLAGAVVAFSRGAAPWELLAALGTDRADGGRSTWRRLCQGESSASPRGVVTRSRSRGHPSLSVR